MKKHGYFYTLKKSVQLALKTAPKAFFGALVLSILTGVLSLATIGSFSILVNKISVLIANGGFQLLSLWQLTLLLLPYLLLLLASFLLPSVVMNFSSLYSNILMDKFMTAIQTNFVKQQMSLDAATIESSDYQNKIQQGNEWGKGSINTVVTRNIAATTDLVSIIVALVVLVSVDLWLGLVAVIAALPVYYIEQKYNRALFRVRRLNTEAHRIIGDRLRLFQSQHSLIELNMFDSSSKFADEVKHNIEAFDENVIAILKKRNLVQVLFRVYTVLFSIIAALLILQKGFAGIIPIGTMLFAFSAYNNFYTSVSGFFQDVAFAQDAVRYALIWFDIFDTKPMIVSAKNAKRPRFTKPPVIEFKNVSFKYSDSEEYAIENINLALHSGEKVAIVGLSGAGKTTLIKLLCRVYDPTEGEILVDGIDLKEIDIQYWHECLGVMFQTYGQYNVTVEESVAIGKNGKKINEEKVVWATEMAGAKTFVENLKKGFKQLLWKGFKGGVDLSKGEHQRIAISRIFYREALVSILDEPTSSVDALTAETIFSNLEEKMEGKTVILISHNFSTVKESSNIVVLENGKIIEQGTHDELHARNGRYAELYDSQASAFAMTE